MNSDFKLTANAMPTAPGRVRDVIRHAIRGFQGVFRRPQGEQSDFPRQERCTNFAAERVLVRDGGCGIDPEVVRSGRNSHWGLPGMRERAKSFGGKLEVWSEQGAGTEIELTVPAAIAYGGSEARRRFWF